MLTLLLLLLLLTTVTQCLAASSGVIDYSSTPTSGGNQKNRGELPISFPPSLSLEVGLLNAAMGSGGAL